MLPFGPQILSQPVRLLQQMTVIRIYNRERENGMRQAWQLRN